MLTPKIKRSLQSIAPFGVIWLLSSWIFLLVELAATGSFSDLPATAIKMDVQIFVLSSIAVTSVGLFTGFMEIKYLHQALVSKSFAIRIGYKLLIYTVFFLLIGLITFPVAASLELDIAFFDHLVWDKYLDFFVSITHLSTGVQLFTSLVLSLFYTEISEFIGHGVLMNFFTGKYHKPVEEERIFMFLDMKSSTTIAEKLGHLAYFELLRAYYDCFTDAIIEHEASIYQYVGDEIILSWPFYGDQRDHTCLDCFFAMREGLRVKDHWFKEKFGLSPTFKAGVHYGKVTTGEIGVIKKEILFSGDVLNAAARIQGLCNTFDVDLIISGELVKQIQLEADYDYRFLGETALKGKEESKELYAVLAL